MIQTKEFAQQDAEEVLALMKTAGWEIRVWENMGYHAELCNSDLIHLHWYQRPGKPRRFHCLLSSERGGGGGSSYWLDKDFYDDPNDAVAGQLAAAAEFNRKVYNVLVHLVNSLYGE